MSPANAHRRLYSDILSREIVQREYSHFKATLGKVDKGLRGGVVSWRHYQARGARMVADALCPRAYPGRRRNFLGESSGEAWCRNS